MGVRGQNINRSSNEKSGQNKPTVSQGQNKQEQKSDSKKPVSKKY